jgi:hypothetical protein
MDSQMNSRVTFSSNILALKMPGEREIAIGNHRYEFFPHRKIMVHILDESGSNQMV